MSKINKSVVSRAYNSNKEMIERGWQKHLQAVRDVGGKETRTKRQWFESKVEGHLDDYGYSTTGQAIESTFDSPTFRSDAELAARHAESGFKGAVNYKEFLRQYGRERGAKGQFTGKYWTSMLSSYPWEFGGHTFELRKRKGAKDSKELYIYVDGVEIQ